MPALVLGDTSGLDPELTRRLYLTTGLSISLQISGGNLTLLLDFLLTTARWAVPTRLVATRRWSGRVIIFVALCRTEPSVLRAVAMGLVALAALGSGSRAAGVRNLAVASMILLLVDPFLSRSIGFTLSVLACAGIVWWAQRWTVIINRWLPPILAESIAVPLAAQLATTPLVAVISERVSVSGLARTHSPVHRRSRDGAGLCGSRSVTDQRSAGRRVRLRGCLVCAGDHLDRRPGFATSWL